GHGGNIEADGALHPVEVVVEAGVPVHEQGGGDPAEVQGELQVLLKGALDKLDGPLHAVAGQRGPVARGDVAVAHRRDLLRLVGCVSHFVSYTIRRKIARETSGAAGALQLQNVPLPGVDDGGVPPLDRPGDVVAVVHVD